MADHPGTTLRRLLAAGPIVVAPGIYDALTAALAEKAGFPALFLSGSALAYTQLGRPDMGLLTAPEIAATLERVTARVAIPVIADADQGFGNAFAVQRTVRLIERAGAAGLQLEDQAEVKPAAAPLSRPLIPLDAMLGKLRAAQDTRANPAFILSARTDAALGPSGFDEALARAQAFAEAGADMVFVEGLKTLEQMRTLRAALPARIPLLHNLLEGRAGPVPDAAALEALGWRMVLFPGAVVQTAAKSIETMLDALKQAGGTVALKDTMFDADGINAALNNQAFAAEGTRYDPPSRS